MPPATGAAPLGGRLRLTVRERRKETQDGKCWRKISFANSEFCIYTEKMTTRSINYYGFEKSAYMECSSLIRSTNRKHITILNTWFLLINLLYLVFSYLYLFGVNQERLPFYGAYFGISLVFEIWLFFFPKTVERFNYFSVFLSIFILLSFGILASVAQPYMPATMFLIMLALTSLSFIGNMAVMFLASVLSVGAFLATSFLFKTFSIAYHDAYNSVIVITLAIGLHYTFQRTRVSQFILYQRDLQIQRELEIKSSFDSLTSLLNRGRFFSITEQILRNRKDEYIALCLLDLDGFKQINDNLGHQMGDKVIQTVGQIIIKSFNLPENEKQNVASWDINKPYPIAGRLGGDEFIIMIHEKSTRAEISEILQKLLDSLNAVKFDGIDASFGVTEVTKSDRDMDNAYKRADEALYESKRAGKNQIHFSENLSEDAQ